MLRSSHQAANESQSADRSQEWRDRDTFTLPESSYYLCLTEPSCDITHDLFRGEHCGSAAGGHLAFTPQFVELRGVRSTDVASFE